MPKIAISYRRADSASIAGRIRERLAAQYGHDSVFIDIHNVPLGSDFPAHLHKVWSEIELLLVLIGRNWLRGAEQISPRLALQYIAVPALLLLVAHYVIVNALDINNNYLRIVSFVVPLLFGAAFFWEARTRPVIAFAVGAVLGLISASTMTISASLRYDQPIMPSDTFEWLSNMEYVVIIALGFQAGNLLARLPRVSLWFQNKEDWVQDEVETALRGSIPMIPVLLDGATMPAPRQLPWNIRQIAYRAATEVRSGLDFDSDVARLIAGIDSILADRTNKQTRGGSTE